MFSYTLKPCLAIVLSQICSENFAAVALKAIEQSKEQKAFSNWPKNQPIDSNKILFGAENSSHRWWTKLSKTKRPWN